jgi:hypothetical protein
MKFQTTRIRRVFQPLMVTVSVETSSAGSSGLLQTYDDVSGEYIPDRTLSPLVLTPLVYAACKDGSWENGIANKNIANIKWYYTEGDSSTVKDAEAYSLLTVTRNQSDTNGQAVMVQNLPMGSRIQLWFTGILPDTRTGENIVVTSDRLILATTENVKGELSISVDGETNIVYVPVLDPLFLYEWAVAHGKAEYNSMVYGQALSDPESYMRHVPFRIQYASETLTSGDIFNACTVKIQEKTQQGGYTDVATGGRLVSVSKSEAVFDLRLIGSWSCYVALVYDGAVIGRVLLSFGRKYPAFDVRAINRAPITDGEIRRDRALVTVNAGKILFYLNYNDYNAYIDCCEALINLVWYTRTQYGERRHNCGQEAKLDLSREVIGKAPSGGWVDVSIDAEYHGVQNIATDGGVVLTDGGEQLII